MLSRLKLKNECIEKEINDNYNFNFFDKIIIYFPISYNRIYYDTIENYKNNIWRFFNNIKTGIINNILGEF